MKAVTLILQSVEIFERTYPEITCRVLETFLKSIFSIVLVKMAEQMAELRTINLYPIKGRKYKYSKIINYESL